MNSIRYIGVLSIVSITSFYLHGMEGTPLLPEKDGIPQASSASLHAIEYINLNALPANVKDPLFLFLNQQSREKEQEFLMFFLYDLIAPSTTKLKTNGEPSWERADRRLISYAAALVNYWEKRGMIEERMKDHALGMLGSTPQGKYLKHYLINYDLLCKEAIKKHLTIHDWKFLEADCIITDAHQVFEVKEGGSLLYKAAPKTEDSPKKLPRFEYPPLPPFSLPHSTASDEVLSNIQ
jgi:hypothetical protein